MKQAKPASEAELMQPENDLRGNSRGKKVRRILKNVPFLIMLFPAILIVFLFNYLPIYGVLIAFQDYMPGDDIFSEYTIWIGFENFTRFFSDVQFWTLMKNTFLLCIEGFLIGFPLPIIIALM
ncbi:MAG: sugar ABC transporter permease, partial [Firmicutes bacterium]|nr:sugar ABC transporter permease [Bacillota bacterium]